MSGTPQERSRSDILDDLLHIRAPVWKLIGEVSHLTWDSPEELVTLTPRDAAAVLERYESGELSEQECVAWANAIEGREDIGFVSGAELLLKEFIFELANPEITEALTAETSRHWRRRLLNPSQ